MLLWDTIEVGRNDAANLINSVYGARLMTRQRAVRIAGMATIIGALLSTGVLETARKGIFKPSMLEPEEAVAIYASVYVVDTVLLYGYSAFGMPVSTTACLVFELLGASCAMSLIRGYQGVVQWGKAGTVVSAIVVSIFLAGFASFLFQRIARGAIRDRWNDCRTIRIHGSWIGGGMAAGLFFFLVLKGAKNAWGVRHIKLAIDNLDEFLRGAIWGDGSTAGPHLGTIVVLFGVWLLFGLLINRLVSRFGERAAERVFPTLAVLGMICMAVAFGQNDLANCASPGLATITLIGHWDKGTAGATAIPIQWWMLFGCGALLFLGMRTKNATRVTRAGVRMGSQTERVNLYAPKWCMALARIFTRKPPEDRPLIPRSKPNQSGKRCHYDPVRASTIMAVSASVIALASSYKLPVSTTYVTFAAVIGTGIGDKVFQRGDAELKIARSIWVIISWFLAAAIAAVFTGLVCVVVYYSIASGLGVTGLVVMIVINLLLRRRFKRQGDAQIERTRQEMIERSKADRPRPSIIEEPEPVAVG